MGLTTALSIATSGLKATEYAISVTSQNVANSSTTGYVEEVANVSAADTLGTGTGVTISGTTRNTSTALQNLLYSKNADVAALTTTDNALATISAAQGATTSDSGTSGTLSDLLGNLQSEFTVLTSTPSDSTAQSTAVSDAEELVSAINTLSDTYQTERQSAQDAIVSSVSTIDTDLTTIGSLSKTIMTLKAQGVDTADLENQRASVMSELSSELSVTYTETSSGDILVKTADGTTLPTRPTDGEDIDIPSSTWPLSTSYTTITAASAYSSTSTSSNIAGIYLDGTDITDSLTGGTLGANITLRDDTLPTMQAQLDSFSYTLAARFDAQGLTLFTDSSGDMPSSSTTLTPPDGIVGLSGSLEVNPDITADSSLIVTGTDGTVTSDTDTTIISNVLSYTFGTTLSDGTEQTSSPSSGLGIDGNLSTGYSGDQSIISLATALTANQAATISTASTDLSTAESVQTSLQTKISNVSGVDVDSEMSNLVVLQNAYTANAKVVTAVQSMFSVLLSAISAG